MKSEAIDVAMKVAVDGKDHGPASDFRAFPCIPWAKSFSEPVPTEHTEGHGKEEALHFEHFAG
jgi:hypothetical protein